MIISTKTALAIANELAVLPREADEISSSRSPTTSTGAFARSLRRLVLDTCTGSQIVDVLTPSANSIKNTVVVRYVTGQNYRFSAPGYVPTLRQSGEFSKCGDCEDVSLVRTESEPQLRRLVCFSI